MVATPSNTVIVVSSEPQEDDKVGCCFIFFILIIIIILLVAYTMLYVSRVNSKYDRSKITNKLPELPKYDLSWIKRIEEMEEEAKRRQEFFET